MREGGGGDTDGAGTNPPLCPSECFWSLVLPGLKASCGQPPSHQAGRLPRVTDPVYTPPHPPTLLPPAATRRCGLRVVVGAAAREQPPRHGRWGPDMCVGDGRARSDHQHAQPRPGDVGPELVPPSDAQLPGLSKAIRVDRCQAGAAVEPVAPTSATSAASAAIPRGDVHIAARRMPRRARHFQQPAGRAICNLLRGLQVQVRLAWVAVRCVRRRRRCPPNRRQPRERPARRVVRYLGRRGHPERRDRRLHLLLRRWLRDGPQQEGLSWRCRC